MVLGYDDIRGYEINGCFFGAIIGRSGNRIENSRFFIDDKEVVLAENENHNNLHSGPDGFEKKMWTASRTAWISSASVRMERTDFRENFPLL